MAFFKQHGFIGQFSTTRWKRIGLKITIKLLGLHPYREKTIVTVGTSQQYNNNLRDKHLYMSNIPLVPNVTVAERSKASVFFWPMTCYWLSPVTNCRLLRIVACYEFLTAMNCRLLRTVACYKLSPAMNCRSITHALSFPNQSQSSLTTFSISPKLQKASFNMISTQM